MVMGKNEKHYFVSISRLLYYDSFILKGNNTDKKVNHGVVL